MNPSLRRFDLDRNLPEVDDSPGDALLTGELKDFRDFGATMYLMWKPTLPPGSSDASHDNTVWVPLRAVNWHWSGTALYDSTNLDWDLTGATYPPNIHDFDVTTEPNWSQIISHQTQ